MLRAKDRVHMAAEKDPDRRLRPETEAKRVPRVVTVPVGGPAGFKRQAFQAAGKFTEAALQGVGHPAQALPIVGSGVDVDPLFQDRGVHPV